MIAFSNNDCTVQEDSVKSEEEASIRYKTTKAQNTKLEEDLSQLKRQLCSVNNMVYTTVILTVVYFFIINIWYFIDSEGCRSGTREKFRRAFKRKELF